MRQFECYRCRTQKPEGAFAWYYPILQEGLCMECSYAMDDIEHDADIEFCEMLQREAVFVALEGSEKSDYMDKIIDDGERIREREQHIYQ